MAGARIPPPPSGPLHIPPPPMSLPVIGGPPQQMPQQMPVHHAPPQNPLPMPNLPGPGAQGKPSAAGARASPVPGPSLRGFEFRKFNKSELESGTPVSWALAQKSELPLGQTEMEHFIKTQRSKSKKTAYDEYKELKSEKMQEHAKLLVDELNVKEPDKSKEWKFALLECFQRRLNASTTDISHMRVFVRRAPKAGMLQASGVLQPHVANLSGQPVNLHQLPPNQDSVSSKGGQNNKPSNAAGPPSLPQGQGAPRPHHPQGPPINLPPPPTGMPPPPVNLPLPPTSIPPPPVNLPPQGYPKSLPLGFHNGNYPVPPQNMPAKVPVGPLPGNNKQAKKQKKPHKNEKEKRGRQRHRKSPRDSSSSDSENEHSSRSSSRSEKSHSTADTDDWMDIRYDMESMNDRIDRLAKRDFKDKYRRLSNASRFPPVPMGHFRPTDQRYLPPAEDRGAKDQPIIQNFHFGPRDASRYSDRNDRMSDESIAAWAGGTSDFSRPWSDGDARISRRPHLQADVMDAYRPHRRPSGYSPGLSPRTSADHLDYPPQRRHSEYYARDPPRAALDHSPAYGTSDFAMSGARPRRDDAVRRKTSDAMDYVRERDRRANRESYRREQERAHSYRRSI